MNSSLVAAAKHYAQQAHDGINHRRKYTDEPYHVHLERVAALVATVTDDQTMIAAAWLHDVIEDVTPKNPAVNPDAIREQFGERVLTLVLELTDISQPQDGNRAIRKAKDRAHTALASPDGKTIKLADLIDNIIDISKHDPHFARVFRKEASLILPSLKEGNAELYQRLAQLLQNA